MKTFTKTGVWVLIDQSRALQVGRTGLTKYFGKAVAKDTRERAEARIKATLRDAPDSGVSSWPFLC